MFGDGNNRIGQDLARAVADTIEKGEDILEVGGPDVLTQNELAELAFECLDNHPKLRIYGMAFVALPLQFSRGPLLQMFMNLLDSF